MSIVTVAPRPTIPSPHSQENPYKNAHSSHTRRSSLLSLSVRVVDVHTDCLAAIYRVDSNLNAIIHISIDPTDRHSDTHSDTVFIEIVGEGSGLKARRAGRVYVKN